MNGHEAYTLLEDAIRLVRIARRNIMLVSRSKYYDDEQKKAAIELDVTQMSLGIYLSDYEYDEDLTKEDGTSHE